MSENVKKNPLTLQDIKDAAARIKKIKQKPAAEICDKA